MALYKDKFCLVPVSKNAKGALKVRAQKKDKCRKPRCTTLKVRYRLDMKLMSHRPCDKMPGLDGKFQANLDVATRTDGRGRGVHDGTFKWASRAGDITGRMRGTTNAGTHRKPPLGRCEPCNVKGRMQGVLDGRIVSGRYKGCRIRASYAMRYDPGRAGQNTAMVATLEGAVLCPCK